jgi:hypothetical protein
LKGTINKYMAGQTLSYAQRYNPLRIQSDDRTWNDANRDDVAQENEIGPSNNLAFGLPVFSRIPDPDGLDREYDIETSLAIQHELMRGLSVSGSWFRRSRHNELRTDNQFVSFEDYLPVQILSPLNGEVITSYNLKPEKRGQLYQIDVNSSDSELRRRIYNGFEVGATGRLRGASFFGGWTFDRLMNVDCDTVDNPNNLRFCDQYNYDVPLRHEFKLSGSYTLPYDIQVNAAFQSYAGPARGTTWNIGTTTRYDANWQAVSGQPCVAPCVLGALVIPSLIPAPGSGTSINVALAEPGSDYYGRMNQLDLGFRKLFRFGRYQYSGQVDIFNFTNNDYVKAETRTVGSSLGRPTSNLQPRTLRLAVQMRF